MIVAGEDHRDPSPFEQRRVIVDRDRVIAVELRGPRPVMGEREDRAGAARVCGGEIAGQPFELRRISKRL